MTTKKYCQNWLPFICIPIKLILMASHVPGNQTELRFWENSKITSLMHFFFKKGSVKLVTTAYDAMYKSLIARQTNES